MREIGRWEGEGEGEVDMCLGWGDELTSLGKERVGLGVVRRV